MTYPEIDPRSISLSSDSTKPRHNVFITSYKSYSHGVVEVVDLAGGFSRRRLADTRILDVADHALYPWQHPSRGHRLVGVMACIRRDEH